MHAQICRSHSVHGILTQIVLIQEKLMHSQLNIHSENEHDFSKMVSLTSCSSSFPEMVVQISVTLVVSNRLTCYSN